MVIEMIIDKLEQLNSYEKLIRDWEKIYAFLMSCSAQTSNGRFEIDGDRIYANVFEYDTSSPDKLSWESHRAYIDMHVILGGEERILWAPAEELTSTSGYNEEKDFRLYSGNYRQIIDAVPGQFTLFFPTDGHKVKCHPAEPSHVKKAVVKIRIR